MMSFTAKQFRAIKWYADTHSLRMSLCAFPTVFFVNKAGETVKRQITGLVSEYERRNSKREIA